MYYSRDNSIVPIDFRISLSHHYKQYECIGIIQMLNTHSPTPHTPITTHCTHTHTHTHTHYKVHTT